MIFGIDKNMREPSRLLENIKLLFNIGIISVFIVIVFFIGAAYIGAIHNIIGLILLVAVVLLFLSYLLYKKLTACNKLEVYDDCLHINNQFFKKKKRIVYYADFEYWDDGLIMYWYMIGSPQLTIKLKKENKDIIVFRDSDLPNFDALVKLLDNNFKDRKKAYDTSSSKRIYWEPHKK